MKITSGADVGAPAAELFELFCDIERVAACLPGARIDGRDGDDYLGSMKVKVGPISADYQGRLRFIELDRERGRARLSASAEDRGGQGAAEAEIVAAVTGDDERSRLDIETDLQVRGRVAQFGRGGMERIAGRMFDQFTANVERALTQPPPAGATAGPAPSSGASGAPAPPPAVEADAPLDALELLVGPGVRSVLRAALPAVLAFGYGYLLGLLRGRGSRPS